MKFSLSGQFPPATSSLTALPVGKAVLGQSGDLFIGLTTEHLLRLNQDTGEFEVTSRSAHSNHPGYAILPEGTQIIITL